MLSASVYIVVCSARNRIRTRLRRLREPKYLVGSVVAAVYLYFTIFARMRTSVGQVQRRGRRPPPDIPIAALQAAGPALVGLALLIFTAGAWLVPSDGSLMEFSDAETQFLFPAPVTRRGLIIHRLVRSQLGLIFASLVPALVFPSGAPWSRAKFAASMWVIMTTLKVHFTGLTLARASLLLPGSEAKRRQWGPPAALLAAIGIVGFSLVQSVRTQPSFRNFDDFVNVLGRVSLNGLSHIVLWPFMAVAAPLFAPWPGPYLIALFLAIAVLGANVLWMLSSDAALQEATAQADAKRAARKASALAMPRVRGRGWTLAPAGRPEMIFAWKNAMQMIRPTSGTTLVRYVVAAVGLSVALSSMMITVAHARGIAAVAGMLAMGVAMFATLLGPQVLRYDLRVDLRHLELLKTWPVQSSAVVRGEMMAPAAMLTAIAWMAIACALPLSAAAFTRTPFADRVAGAVALALLAPGLIAAQFTIHNAAALLFPGWVPLGNERPRGLDAMGQRMIMLGGVMLGLIVMVAPAAAVGGILVFAFRWLLGSAVFVPAAAAVTGLVLLEVLLLTEALAPLYEGIDVTAVERAE